MLASFKATCSLILCLAASISALELAKRAVPIVGQGEFCSQLQAMCNRDEGLYCARSSKDMEDVRFGYCQPFPEDQSGGLGEQCFSGCLSRDAGCCREGYYCGCATADYCRDAEKVCVELPDFEQEGCGGEGQTCCRYQWLLTNQESCAEGLVCNTKNTCTNCGSEGNPCCRKSGPDFVERICGEGMYCKWDPRKSSLESECVKGTWGGLDAGDCGQSGKACCEDVGTTPCGPGMVCYSNSCQACGGDGEKCCADNACNDGFACEDRQCVSRPPPDPQNCGNPGQPCCLADSFYKSDLVYCNAGSYCFDDSRSDDDKVIGDFSRSHNAQCVAFEGQGCGKEGEECCHRAACDAGMYCDTQMSRLSGTCDGVCDEGTDPPSVCKRFDANEGGEGQPCFSGFYRFETRALNQCLCREGMVCSEHTGKCMKNPDSCGAVGSQCCRKDTGLVSDDKSVRCQRYFRCNCSGSGSCGVVGCSEDAKCTCANTQLPVKEGSRFTRTLCVEAIA
ncbi:hypothetical protein BSKO_05660 [Bryopsis sp. KO-2023]|nr:hypothetical protein BSKO_05660 [Bryopsis sp. KO-2023]